MHVHGGFALGMHVSSKAKRDVNFHDEGKARGNVDCVMSTAVGLTMARTRRGAEALNTPAGAGLQGTVRNVKRSSHAHNHSMHWRSDS